MGASFQISTPFAALQQKLETAKQQIQDDKQQLLQAIGVTILSLNQLDYRTLSRGGTASDGRRWAALDPKTVKRKASRGRGEGSKARTGSGKVLPVGNVSAIGIDTGLQFASGSPGFDSPGGGNVFEVSQTNVKVGYGRSYSKYFDMKRKLIPDTLPASWRQLLESIVDRWLQNIVAGTILKE